MLGAAVLPAAACGGRGAEAPPSTPSPPLGEPVQPAPDPALPPAPWSAAPLADVAAPYHAAWRSAENRGRCALLAFREARAEGMAATPRVATFGGGWGVAYDVPGLRSAFGVAGTGVEPGPGTYDDWPHRVRWRDGSEAGYGPEGGTGPNQLAYLRVPGQRCLYNVWSRLGREHLERLLGELRFVRGASH